MDSKLHSQFTGTKAKISREVGGKFTAYDGAIVGRNLKLVPDKLIVQEWYCQTEGWPQGHYSKLAFKLSKADTGCLLEMVQEGVPKAAIKDITQGWKDYYWKPLGEMFEKKT